MNLDKKLDPKSLTGGSQLYYLRRQEWIDAINLYEPVPYILGTYLRRNKKEDQAEFNARLTKICQINYVFNAVDFYKAMIWSTSVDITSEGVLKKAVDTFTNKCNLRGDDFRTYCKERVTPLGLLFGSVDTFADLPKVADSDAPISLWEQQKRGLDQPYVYAVPPLNRLQWSNDEAGNFTFYKSQDVIDREIGASLEIGQQHQYNLWTLDTVYQYNANGEQTDAVSNPYGVIPCVTIAPLGTIRFQDRELGTSLVQDLVPMQINLLNALSELFDFHHFANFPQLVVNRDPMTPTGALGDEGEDIEVGMHRLLELWGQGKAEWITPAAGAILAKQEFIFDKLICEMYRNILIPPTEIKTHTSEGGIKMNLQQLFTRLTSMAQNIASGMARIIKMSLLVQGYSRDDIEAANIQVKFDTNWSYEAFTDALKELELTRATLGDLSHTAVKEFAKRVISSRLYNSPEMEKITGEIDASNAQPVVTAIPTVPAKGAGGGKGKAASTAAENEVLTATNTEMRAVREAVKY